MNRRREKKVGRKKVTNPLLPGSSDESLPLGTGVVIQASLSLSFRQWWSIATPTQPWPLPPEICEPCAAVAPAPPLWHPLQVSAGVTCAGGGVRQVYATLHVQHKSLVHVM